MDFGYQHKIKQMNDSWHIPRASLNGSTAGSSSNSSSKSNSNPPTVTRLNSRQLTRYHQKKNINDNDMNQIQNHEQIIKNLTATTPTIYLGFNINDNIISTSRNNTDIIMVHRNRTDNKDGNDLSSYHNNYDQYYEMNPSGSNDDRKLKKLMMTNIDNSSGGIKRGSRSSQGSTDSHSSSRSGSSGSLLLTAANLERFVAIHNKTNLQQSKLYQLQYGGQYRTNITSSAYSQNPLGNVDENDIERIDKNQSINNNDTVLEIDPNLEFIKTKDVDTMSIASSTHFTMVNGVGGPQKKIRSGICSRGHQITVLILTMSGFFLIGILLMVYLMEMRAREMPQ